MTDFIRVAGAQVNLTVGDFEGNAGIIAEAMAFAEDVQADVLLTPELSIPGYPPEDLVLRRAFVNENLQAMHELASRSKGCVTVVGFIDSAEEVVRDDAGHGRAFNAAALLSGGRVRGIYHKALLPNYSVFDEDRYFAAGRDRGALWEINGVRVGLSICEDIWVPDGPPAEQAALGAELILNINGSPYYQGKDIARTAMLAERARAMGLPLVYLNLVGGQDELVFDGESMVFGPDGGLLYRAPQFAEDLFWVDLPIPETVDGRGEAVVVSTGSLLDGDPEPSPELQPPLDGDAEVYQALVTGLYDYVTKNRFTEVVIGLSGGIDSALTAAIAVDALGADAVRGITMPSRYSSSGSVEDSRALAENLGMRFDEIPIEEPFTGFLRALEPVFAETDADVTEENLQARVRGAMLMAISNKFGPMVVATGNKSEMAVGYATLYGDMVGGFAVLKDVFKTQVYRLARWRNGVAPVIPEPTLDKPPSAELRPGQQDTDSLPPYEVLDEILELYIEQDASPKEIAKRTGRDRDLIAQVTQMVDRNEYKRRQAAPGVKITPKALGRDRRLPITNGYRT